MRPKRKPLYINNDIGEILSSQYDYFFPVKSLPMRDGNRSGSKNRWLPLDLECWLITCITIRRHSGIDCFSLFSWVSSRCFGSYCYVKPWLVRFNITFNNVSESWIKFWRLWASFRDYWKPTRTIPILYRSWTKNWNMFRLCLTASNIV